jgi:hypothetical protein
MKLVSSAETINFLGNSAPRPWVKRMMLWMIYTDELKPFFTAGRIVPSAMLISVISQIEGIDPTGPLDARDAAIRAYFNEEVAERLVGRRIYDHVEDDPIVWDETDEPHRVGPGFFLYSDDIDWEQGRLIAELVEPSLGDLQDHAFWDAEEHLGSSFPKPDFKVDLRGLCFHWEEVEMMQPSHELYAGKQSLIATSRANVGRPRKWDWDGALTHLLSVAQHPDGLPTGPGAQASIENLISEWFVQSTGETPTSSQLRSYAQKVMQALKTPETPI